MKNTSAEVDAYIEKAAKFAQPILKKVRRLFHKACPEIEETIKWGTPCFERRGIVAGIAAFKQHVRFGFWKGQMMNDPHKIFNDVGDSTMNAIKLTDVKDLPADSVLIAYIKEAVELNAPGKTPAAKKKKKKKADLPIPDDLAAALKKNKKANAAFDKFPPSHKREYIEWITEAKRVETRQKRIATAIEWMSDGKPKNWKYKK